MDQINLKTLTHQESSGYMQLLRVKKGNFTILSK
jgi:hypothetical protein